MRKLKIVYFFENRVLKQNIVNLEVGVVCRGIFIN